MKKVVIEVDTYSFDELSPDAQEKAISDYMEAYFMMTSYNDLSDMAKKAVDKAEQMRTPWFTTSYYYEYGAYEIKETLREPEYSFAIDGSIFTIPMYGSEVK